MVRIFACFLFLGIIFLHVICVSLASVAVSAEQCFDYGYNSEKLSCSTCKQLVAKVFTEQHEVYTKCLSCCRNDESQNASDEMFEKAVLMVDKTALKFLPDIDYMVKNKKKYNITVKYRYGPPQLALYKQRDDGDPSDFISIHNWTKDTIIEYLVSHLSKDGQEKKKIKTKK